jgi:hypothetical protein
MSINNIKATGPTTKQMMRPHQPPNLPLLIPIPKLPPMLRLFIPLIDRIDWYGPNKGISYIARSINLEGFLILVEELVVLMLLFLLV